MYYCRLEGLGAADIQSEDDQGTDSECDPPNWQHLVRPEVLAGLRPHEIKRQEVIHGEDWHCQTPLKLILYFQSILSICFKILQYTEYSV